jgi:hypothetical protein
MLGLPNPNVIGREGGREEDKHPWLYIMVVHYWRGMT